MIEHEKNICLHVLGKEAGDRRKLADDVERTKIDAPGERAFYMERGRILREEADALEKGMLLILAEGPATEEAAVVAAGGA